MLLCITTAVEKTAHTAYHALRSAIGTACPREVPRAGFAAAQDDNGFKMTTLNAAIAPLENDSRRRWAWPPIS